ncbi:MAG: DUF5693 family protein [Fimbriimonadaceae bacterium]
MACVAITAALSLVSIAARYRVEERNRSVSICAEYETVESLAASQGITIDRALASLREQGLRSVALTEETAGELVAEGRLAVRYDRGTSGAPTSSPIVSGAPDDLKRLVRGNRIRYGAFSAPNQVGADQQFPNLTPGMLRALPLGIDPEAAKHVRDAHLTIVARMGNPVGISLQGVMDTVAWAAEIGAKVFCPIGDQVLGRRKGLTELAKALTAHDMLYASPEFAKIGGDQQMLQLAPELVVRLHSAQAAELDKLPYPEAIDRYSRAARERGMRILLLRPVDYAAEQPLYEFGTFVKGVAQAVIKEGGRLGDAHAFTQPFPDTQLYRLLYMLIGLSLVPIVWWTGSVFQPKVGWLGLGVAVLFGLAAHSPHLRQWASLLGAITLPITGYFVLDALKSRSVFGGYVLTTLISLTGGLTVAGLLSSLPYYIRAYEFQGVKLAVFLPIIVVGVYFLWRLTDARETLDSPIRWRIALITLVILGALGFMLLRTGNDNPAAVSSWELKFRDFLDAALFVRPRTKTFLIGFPLLYIGVAMLMRYRGAASSRSAMGGWTALVLAGGAIGQTDVVNTLCHIHTPVALSLERIGVAFVVGSILGFAGWTVVSRWLPPAAPVDG